MALGFDWIGNFAFALTYDENKTNGLIRIILVRTGERNKKEPSSHFSHKETVGLYKMQGVSAVSSVGQLGKLFGSPIFKKPKQQQKISAAERKKFNVSSLRQPANIT